MTLFQEYHPLCFGETFEQETIEIGSRSMIGGIPYRHVGAGCIVPVYEHINKLPGRVIKLETGIAIMRQ